MACAANPKRDWKNHLDHLIAEVLAVTRRDPGCRFLVAVNVRYCHHLRHALRGRSDVRVVDFSEL